MENLLYKVAFTVYFPTTYLWEEDIQAVSKNLKKGEAALIYWEVPRTISSNFIKSPKTYRQFLLKESDVVSYVYNTEIMDLQRS